MESERQKKKKKNKVEFSPLSIQGIDLIEIHQNRSRRQSRAPQFAISEIR